MHTELEQKMNLFLAALESGAFDDKIMKQQFVDALKGSTSANKLQALKEDELTRLIGLESQVTNLEYGNAEMYNDMRNLAKAISKMHRHLTRLDTTDLEQDWYQIEDTLKKYGAY